MTSPLIPGTNSAAQKPLKGAFDMHKVWAALLIVDSVFIIIFGGAVFSKIYQHWSAPPTLVKVPPPRKKPPEPPKPAEAPAGPAPAAALKPEPAAPAPAPAPKAEKLPKPSLIESKALPRKAPPPQEPGAAAPARKVKAVPVEFKYQSASAKSVQVAGAFIMRAGKKDMARAADGSWTLTLYLTPGDYRYSFIVNGKKMTDPANPKTDRGASVMSVP